MQGTLAKVISLTLFSCLLVLMPAKCFATTQASIHISTVKLNGATLLRYQQILQNALGQSVNVAEAINLLNADILITDALQQNSQWIKSYYLLDTIPAFDLITLSVAQVSNPLYGAIRHEYLLKSQQNSYIVDDRDSAVKLLAKNKIDGIIDFRENQARYYRELPNVVITPLSEKKAVYVYFRDANMAANYSKSAISLKHTPKKNSNRQSDSDALQWYLIVKKFDTELGKLVPYSEDEQVLKMLNSEFNSKHIDSGSTAIGFQQLSNQNNLCILNTIKSEERLAVADYSNASALYFNYRLYTLRYEPPEQQLLPLLNDEKIDIIELFQKHTDAIFGYYRFSVQSFDQQLRALIDANPERFIIIDESKLRDSYEYLKRKRIDYLIGLPRLLKDSKPHDSISFNFQSYTMVGYEDLSPSFIACSKSALSDKALAQINKLLASNKFIEQLIAIYTKGMTSNTQQIFAQSFKKLHSLKN
ncbi:hypothetical protein HII17_10610 [Thalassotalea sp. M1531]|uniref:Solute-binding protein family 3/N-terminal domain-containing protein n=1 Tax=Thalassotalea algicola TaxID=2716224 RepID=A0A7Y0LCG4_9GAMM|nr:hypothetical protein [Thalassotalea algicola]NMP32019.1 hypothetical protein [Thalassotalea algicola]